MVENYPKRVFDIIFYGGAVLVLLIGIFTICMIVLTYYGGQLLQRGSKTIKTVNEEVVQPVASIAAVLIPTAGIAHSLFSVLGFGKKKKTKVVKN